MFDSVDNQVIEMKAKALAECLGVGVALGVTTAVVVVGFKLVGAAKIATYAAGASLSLGYGIANGIRMHKEEKKLREQAASLGQV